MTLPNPIYIDEAARHDANQVRLLAHMAMVGQRGVLEPTHLQVLELETPGAAVRVMPGAYTAHNTASGGGHESYVGKVPSAVEANVSPTDSSGSRTDLVILRVENPYVVGTGSWDVPGDAEEGPYAHIRIVEGVAANTQTVTSVNADWTALTLARITRDANTGIVEQGHITDLRSLAALGGGRNVEVEEPGPEQPPIARDWFVAVAHSGTEDTFAATHTNWVDWPSVASWTVPIPDWATRVVIDCAVQNPQIRDFDVFGEIRASIAGVATTPTTFAHEFVTQPARVYLPFATTYQIPSGIRGKNATVKFQARSFFTHEGKLVARDGTNSRLALYFQRSL